MIIVVMGPSGSGKTTVGRALATALAWPFVDTDDLHDTAARAKMAAGVPLDEADRAPWLARVYQRLTELAATGPGVVLACSALRRQHRDTLRTAGREVRFVLLEADEATLSRRVAARRDHFMPATLVASQLATLERSPDLVSVDATRPVDEIVAEVRARLGLGAGPWRHRDRARHGAARRGWPARTPRGPRRWSPGARCSPRCVAGRRRRS